MGISFLYIWDMIKNKTKEKLQEEVSKLSKKNLGTHHLMDMTHEMEELCYWALYNAPIKQLRAWKKEFKNSS